MNWSIKKEWLITTPGVVAALGIALRAFSKPGDKVIIQPPVYYPFNKMIHANGRVTVENPLIRSGRTYLMDYDDLEKKLRAGASMLVLCSPHNPVGRVWKKDELIAVSELCSKYNTLIISDEIHSDLLMPGHRHTVLAGLSAEAGLNAVTFTAASKTFNLAGLACSNIIISNPEYRKSFKKVIESMAVETPNIFGLVATETGYRTGEKWLDRLCCYINDNYSLLKKFINERLPEIRVTPLEGTYLAWLDFSGFHLDDETVNNIILKRAKVWLDNGPQFGTGGSGFQRINLACPEKILRQALVRIEDAFKGIN